MQASTSACLVSLFGVAALWWCLVPPATSPDVRLLSGNVDARATNVEQEVLGKDGKASWSLRARLLSIQRRRVLVFGVAANDEVVLLGCRIEAEREQEAFQPVAEHFAPMRVVLHDVDLVLREGHKRAHFAHVDLRPGHAPRIVEANP